MRTIKKLFAILPVLFLLSCSQEEPILIPKEKSDLFGVWVYKYNEYGNNVKIDNMLLAFHSDSTVSYKRCIQRMSGHKTTSVPEARIIKLTDKELVIKVNLFIFRMRLNFNIEQLPYKEKDDWYMKVDGVLLRKLRPGEKSDHDSWACGDDSKQDMKNNEGVKI